jgi:hypothetical protein
VLLVLLDADFEAREIWEADRRGRRGSDHEARICRSFEQLRVLYWNLFFRFPQLDAATSDVPPVVVALTHETAALRPNGIGSASMDVS